MALAPYRPFNNLFPAVDKMFEGFFNDDFWAGSGLSLRGTVPAVNIHETATAFEVHVAAPGLEKGDFNIELAHDVLKVSAQKEVTNEEKTEDKVLRREFAYTSFQRSFSLPKNVESEQINATYTDGVLKITLPKKETAVAKPTKTISIG
ncbi:MAG: Hsp20/alpha crystallin family protein [Bernardetiaceae bacterium]|jgi:HSP20 family protein|nr:Hsp20/alpha crystallin family protein [Bernardetiaceae bacterium]